MIFDKRVKNAQPNFNLFPGYLSPTNIDQFIAKAYSSAWEKNDRFKHRNLTDVVTKELEKAEFDHLVLAAPTVDITNMETRNHKAEDSTEILKQKVEASCRN